MNRGTNRRRFRWLSLVAIGATAALLAACSAPADSGDGGDEEQVYLGIVGYSDAVAQSNEVLQTIVELGEAEGWKVEFQNANPAGDAASANSIMQVMLTKGANILVTANFDPDQLATGISAAKEAGVPVLAASAGKLADGVSWASDVGYVPAMGDAIKADYADYDEVQVLNLTYLLATPGQGRNRLIQDVAADDPKFKLTDNEVPIPGAVQGGRDSTAAWLAAHPPKEGVGLVIYAVFDQPAEGAVAALKQAGRTDVGIYSYDATPQGLALVKEGYILGNIWNGGDGQSKQIFTAVKDVLAGKYTAENPQLDPVAFELITPDNVADFEKEHPESFVVAG